jgi:hypothetical protein
MFKYSSCILSTGHCRCSSSHCGEARLKIPKSQAAELLEGFQLVLFSAPSKYPIRAMKSKDDHLLHRVQYMSALKFFREMFVCVIQERQAGGWRGLTTGGIKVTV